MVLISVLIIFCSFVFNENNDNILILVKWNGFSVSLLVYGWLIQTFDSKGLHASLWLSFCFYGWMVDDFRENGFTMCLYMESVYRIGRMYD